MIARLRSDAARIPLADGSVSCCITSPPYFGLRRYANVPETAWGAWRGTLGNEPTVDLYVSHIVECFREVRRVLRDDGVCWIVIGDSFAGSGHGAWAPTPEQRARVKETYIPGPGELVVSRELPAGNLLMIPWRVAIALQTDGWIVRNDLAWCKRAAMPESLSGTRWERHRVRADGALTERDGMNGSGRRPHGATISEPQRLGAWPERPNQNHDGHDFAARAEWRDCPGCVACASSDGLVLRRGSWRHTRGHEVVLMLAKSMGYWSDAQAVAESAVSDHGSGNGYRREARESYADDDGPRGSDETWEPAPGATRNPRSFMVLGPEPLRAAHFAAFPTALVEPLLLATCPARACTACGAGWVRIVERRGSGSNMPAAGGPKAEASQREREAGGLGRLDGGRRVQMDGTFNNNPAARPGGPSTLGWRPACSCNTTDSVPGTVLDPFAGSGTVGRVAVRHRRRAVLCDLSQTYLRDIADGRTRDVQTEMSL